MKRMVWKILPFILVGLLCLTVSAWAKAPIQPGGPFVPPNQEVNLSAIMTFDEVEAELLKLEKRSKGLLEVHIAGNTQENRPLYIAEIGWGPKRMWIQGRIHGNEPFGNDVCLAIIKSLLNSDRDILDEITFYIIPSYNPDGSERFWRGNATPTRWDDDDNPTAGVDLNRNWWREDGNDYSELESQAFYWEWAGFRPHYAIDIHHQGTYFVEDEDGEDTNQMTTFSIGIPVWPQDLDPLIWDDSRRMAVAGYDAVKDLGFCNPTRYPLINIHTAVISSMLLGNPGPDGHDAEWESAAMFFETRGGIGNKSRGYLIKQNLEAIHAIIDAIAYDYLGDVNPDRWDEIPDRGSSIRTSDKWPAEWAE
jgi:zinc carboxypeptidase